MGRGLWATSRFQHCADVQVGKLVGSRPRHSVCVWDEPCGRPPWSVGLRGGLAMDWRPDLTWVNIVMRSSSGDDRLGMVYQPRIHGLLDGRSGLNLWGSGWLIVLARRAPAPAARPSCAFIGRAGYSDRRLSIRRIQ